ncbi:hypothetical protein RhiirA1_480839 [Rhizophagus irregularis]|uniref:Uncharacterized protein n=1 Tax=Rhizophagus irregularis TaxID=588596 RepID=A0A2N0QNU6_9GLOM|nr:hypothetical protein RhiirA1_480839 [Rhizophagus irregularis]
MPLCVATDYTTYLSFLELPKLPGHSNNINQNLAVEFKKTFVEQHLEVADKSFIKTKIMTRSTERDYLTMLLSEYIGDIALPNSITHELFKNTKEMNNKATIIEARTTKNQDVLKESLQKNQEVLKELLQQCLAMSKPLVFIKYVSDIFKIYQKYDIPIYVISVLTIC